MIHIHKVLENHRTVVRNVRRDIKEAIDKLEKGKKFSRCGCGRVCEIRVLATERRIHLEEDRSVASLLGRLPVRDLNFDLGREGGTLLAPLER
jgi:hypothetical protein